MGSICATPCWLGDFTFRKLEKQFEFVPAECERLSKITHSRVTVEQGKIGAED